MASDGGGWNKSTILTLVIALFVLKGEGYAERPMEVAAGCHRKGHKVTCRAWRGPDAPEIPPSSSWSDFWVLDLSDVDAARRVDMKLRGTTCHVQGGAWEWRGLGAALADGRLPARWLGARYRGLIVLYLRGLGLRNVHRDAFELLTVVQHVYLSSNRLETLHPDMWRQNERLTGVSLENNVGLRLAEDQPLFRSDQMEYLDLSGCGLRTVPQKAFQELPRLQILNLDRNCLYAVPAPALALVSDLWSVALSENVIAGLSEDEATLLARLPDVFFLVNPWRCDCALRDTLEALEGDARAYWKQSMDDLVCRWPPEDSEQPWEKVLTRDTCRSFNETLENATNTDIADTTSANSSSTESVADEGDEEAGSAGASSAATQCETRGDGGSAFCKWTAGATLLLLALGLLAFAVAAFTDRVSVTVSGSGGARSKGRRVARAETSLSRANLTDNTQDNAEFLHDHDLEDGRPQGRDDAWDVVRFGRGT